MWRRMTWRGKLSMSMAAIVLALGLAARADESDAPKQADRETTDREAAEGERKGDREAAERERKIDAEAAERERQGDREAGERERRRDREPGDRQRRPDEGRRGPPEPPRGAVRREGMRENMMGGGMMGGMMQGMGGMMGGGMAMDEQRLRESDPEMFELEQNDRRLDRESHALAEQYRRTPEGPAREEIRSKLREAVGRHFKARQERRELEVKRLEAQLDRLRGALERRAKDADALIDRRMSQLLGDEDFGF